MIERRLAYEIGPAAEALGLGLIPWGPDAQGWLSGRYGRSGPPAGTRTAEAEPGRVEAWERRAQERTWRIVGAVREVAAECGRPMSRAALDRLLARPGIRAPIVGARRLEQLEENLGAVGWRPAPGQVHPYDAPAGARRRLPG